MAFTFDPVALRDRIIAELRAANIELGSNAEEAWLAIAKGFGAADLWENVAIIPNVAGLNRPITTIVRQVTDLTSKAPVALWLKVGAAATAWVNLGGGGGDDHTVKADDTDTDFGSLYDKQTPGDGIGISVVTVNNRKRVQITNTKPADHLVLARTSPLDATAPGGLKEKTLAGDGTLLDVVADAADANKEKLRTRVDFGVNDPLPDGIPTPGDDKKPVHGNHIHPRAPSEFGDLYFSSSEGIHLHSLRRSADLTPSDESKYVYNGQPEEQRLIFDGATQLNDPGRALWIASLYYFTVFLKVGSHSGKVRFRAYRESNEGLGSVQIGDDIVTPTITNTTWQEFRFHAAMPESNALANNRLRIIGWGETDEVYPQSVDIYIGTGGTHASSVNVPYGKVSGSTSTIVHAETTNRDAASSHPAEAIATTVAGYPAGGVLTAEEDTVQKALVALSDALLSLDDWAPVTMVGSFLTLIPGFRNFLVTVDASQILQGISVTGFRPGTPINLTFLQPVRLIHGASFEGTANAPLFLVRANGTPQPVDFNGRTPVSNGRVQLQLRTDTGITPHPCWQLIAGPIA